MAVAVGSMSAAALNVSSAMAAVDSANNFWMAFSPSLAHSDSWTLFCGHCGDIDSELLSVSLKSGTSTSCVAMGSGGGGAGIIISISMAVIVRVFRKLFSHKNVNYVLHLLAFSVSVECVHEFNVVSEESYHFLNFVPVGTNIYVFIRVSSQLSLANLSY